MKRILWLMTLLLVAGCSGNPLRQPSQPQVGESLPSSADAKPGDARTRAKAHTDLGMAYYQGSNMATALQEARVALQADSEYAPAYNLLGLVQMYLGETAEAETSFRRSLGIAPGDPDANNHYGWFLCLNGREKEGIAHLMTAVRNPLYQTPTRPYTNAGLCSLRLKDEAAAEDYFKKAVIADQRNNQALYHLANLSYKRGDYRNAQRFIGAVNEQMEPNAESLWLALRVERKLGDLQAEAKYANQLRRNFVGSKEYQAMTQGRFE